MAVTVVNLLTFAPPWLVLLPGLRFWPALMMTQATTALSIVVPGGAAVGIATAYGMLRRAGFARSAIARSVTLVSLWNQLANLAYPIVAVFLLTIAGEETAVLATVAFVGVAILGVVVAALVLVLYSSRMAADIGDLAARGSHPGQRRASTVSRSRGAEAASSASESTSSTCSSGAGTCSRSPRSPAA